MDSVHGAGRPAGPGGCGCRTTPAGRSFQRSGQSVQGVCRGVHTGESEAAAASQDARALRQSRHEACGRVAEGGDGLVLGVRALEGRRCQPASRTRARVRRHAEALGPSEEARRRVPRGHGGRRVPREDRGRKGRRARLGRVDRRFSRRLQKEARGGEEGRAGALGETRRCGPDADA